MDGSECRESSFKELPTKELKVKRNKDRRDSLTIPPIRLRLKYNVSPLNSETEADKCFSDRSISSSPDSCSQENSPVFASNSYNKISSQINSPPSSPLINESNNKPGEAFHFTKISSNSVEEEDYNQPLDMSRKRSQKSTVCSESHPQQLRPSVITCASALLRTQCSLSDVAHQICTVNVNDSNNNDENENGNEGNNENNKGNDDKESKIIRPGHRREIVSGSCDPIIDEHFRRSLGKDYQNIFTKSSMNSVSITVDDHFAKALGDTWHQLKQTKTLNVDSPRSPSSLQSQKPQQFVHQSPEIFS